MGDDPRGHAARDPTKVRHAVFGPRGRPCAGLSAESGSVEVDDTLEFLLGTWALTRSIEDLGSGARGLFVATAAVVATQRAEAAGVVRRARYGESGVLRVGSYAGTASRRLDYARGGAGAVTVSFPGGAEFLELDLRSGRSRGVHCCGSDRYEIVTTVRSPSVVEERWRVRGSSKRYDAVTTLTRLDR